MPEVAVDFAAGLSSLEELQGAAPKLINFLPAPDGSLRIRPLVQPWSDFPAPAPAGDPIVGLTIWKGNVVYVSQNATTGVRKLWAWQGPSNVIALSDSTSATQLEGTGRPVFTMDSDRVVVAGGGAPQKWDGTGLSSRLGGSPPNVSHLGYAATRFIGNASDLSGILYWTPPGVGNHETWNTSLDFAEAESAPDAVVGLYTAANEAFAFGQSTTQIFVPDPETAFSTTTASLSVGCAAPYSPLNCDSTFSWLDDRRRFVDSDARQFNLLSSPTLAKSVSKLGTVADCWGARIRIDAWDLLVWTFPTEGKTLCYDRSTKKWSEWLSFDGVNWTPWVGQSYVYWPDENLHLVGLADGTIGTLSLDATVELSQGVKAVSRTGFMDGGTSNRKLSKVLRLKLRRGTTATTSSTVPVAEIAYRDDLGAFVGRQQFSLGAGDYAPVIERWGLGQYRTRQYELTFMGSAEFVLSEAKEMLEPCET